MLQDIIIWEIVIMLPISIAGAVITGSALLSKYAAASRAGRPTEFLRYDPEPIDLPRLVGSIQVPSSIRLPDISNQLHNVLDGLSSTVSQLTKSIAGEDYFNVVSGFLPPDASILKPRHFKNTGELGLIDLDGDNKDELVASYKCSQGVGTIVLKKDRNQWYRVADLLIPGYDTVKFRDTVDVTGSGKQHLLLGLPGPNKKTVLQAYALEGETFVKMFEHNCSRFEVLGNRKAGNTLASPVQFAFWDNESSGEQRIDLMHWNGLGLEPVADKTKYYARKVVPMQVQMLKRSPNSPRNWYNFARALAEAGYTEDAAAAADTGIKFDRDSLYTEKFNELKNML